MPQVYDSSKVGEGSAGEAATGGEGLPPQSGGIFSAFLSQPVGVSFDTEEEGEKVILILRKHGITNLSWMATTVVMIFVPLVLTIFPLLVAFPQRYQVLAVCFWYVITTAFVFENFLNWFYNVFIITNLRIIDVDFLSLIYRRFSQCHVEQIENISFSQGGVARTMFDYGSVLVQTAAEIENVKFEDVPNPDRVTKVIDSLIPESTNKEGKAD